MRRHPAERADARPGPAVLLRCLTPVKVRAPVYSTLCGSYSSPVYAVPCLDGQGTWQKMIKLLLLDNLVNVCALTGAVNGVVSHKAPK